MARATKQAETKNVPAVKAAKTALPMAYDADSDAGFEGADRQSYAIPFLFILQSLSPQTKKSDGAYIKGAEEGMLYNSVSNEVYDGDTGLRVIPCAFARTFVEWIQREKGGGFIGEYDAVAGEAMRATAKRDDKNRDILRNGHQLNDTRNHYLLVETSPGRWEPMMLSLTSTQIRASRNWMSAMKRECDASKVPMFATVWRMTTTPQSNEKGSWSGAVFEHDGFVEEPDVYERAKAFYEQVRKGAVKTQDRGEATATVGGAGDDNPDEM